MKLVVAIVTDATMDIVKGEVYTVNNTFRRDRQEWYWLTKDGKTIDAPKYYFVNK